MEYKTIKSLNNTYLAGFDGSIKRITDVVDFGNNKRKIGGTCLKPKTKKNGYLEVNPYINKVGKSRYVHRLVAEAWLGVIVDKMTINHKDGNKQNNTVSNLEIVSMSDNLKHSYRLGLREPLCIRGSDSVLSKLTESLVIKMRKEHSIHRSIKQICLDYPEYSQGCLAKAIYKQTWSHV